MVDELAVKNAGEEERLHELLAFAALPAAGAWQDSEVVNVAGYAWAMLYFAYQRGGANGSVNFRVLVSPYSSDQAGKENWYLPSLHAAGTVTAGQEAASQVQREWDNFKAHFGGVETFAFGPVQLARCVERLKVQAAEYGNAGSPGSCSVQAIFNEA